MSDNASGITAFVLAGGGGFSAGASAMHALNLMIARRMVTDIEHIGDELEVAVVPALCRVDVSPYDFTRAGELIDRAADGTRNWLDVGGLARRGIPHQLQSYTYDRTH